MGSIMDSMECIQSFISKQKNPIVRSLLEEGILHPVDLLFTNRHSSLTEKGRLFMAFLLAKAREGHLCVTIQDNKLVPGISPSVDSILVEGASELPPIDREIVYENKRWYLRKNWEYEKAFLTNWKRLQNTSPEIPLPEYSFIHELDKHPLHERQKQAILNAAKQSLSLICGGPGTGKTYTASLCVQIFSNFIGKIALAAPTGKAAANLRSSIGKAAERCTVKTLHSLLKKREPLDFDLILVDEGSMIDARLMAELFASIKEGARLILLGDPNQLPPVESGNFFADMTHSSIENVTMLTHCLRTDLKEILEMADSVKQGKEIPFLPLPRVEELIENVAAKFPLTEEWEENLREYYQRFRILTPLRKGPYGVDFLNKKMYERHSEMLRQKVKTIGVPIMITRNDPSLELFNGDTGFLIQEREGEGYALFAEGKKIPVYLLPHYEYAYFLSVHKSQGSEYESVMILLPEGAECFGREMLYTAITRAKREVILYAKETTLKEMLGKKAGRYSGLIAPEEGDSGSKKANPCTYQ